MRKIRATRTYMKVVWNGQTLLQANLPRGASLRIDMYGPTVMLPGVLSGGSMFRGPQFGQRYGVVVAPSNASGRLLV